MPTDYSKPALSISEQIELLESRGLIISNKSYAQHFLQFISYYRLSGYTIVFEKRINGKRNHQFKNGTTFEDIINLYNFDRHLRMLVMDAMERIEVAVRAQICLTMALTYKDSHWYLRQDLFKSEFGHDSFLQKCKLEQEKSKERFVLHYKENYNSPASVPCWMMIELLPMGTWSRVYKDLVNRADKKQISDTFKLSPRELQSWLHCLTYIRNLCAHHARLWNRRFTVSPMTSTLYPHYFSPNTTFAAQAAMMHIILKVISPDSKWTVRLLDLFKNHLFIEPRIMGFPERWVEDEFWGLS